MKLSLFVFVATVEILTNSFGEVAWAQSLEEQIQNEKTILEATKKEVERMQKERDQVSTIATQMTFTAMKAISDKASPDVIKTVTDSAKEFSAKVDLLNFQIEAKLNAVRVHELNIEVKMLKAEWAKFAQILTNLNLTGTAPLTNGTNAAVTAPNSKASNTNSGTSIELK